MKTKDPYLSELDQLDDLEPPEEEPTDFHLESPPAPEPTGEETAPEGGEEVLKVAGGVPVSLVVVLGRKELTMKDLMELKIGQVVELNRVPQEAVDLVVSGRVIAKGELVEIDGKMGVRVLKILK